MMRYFCCAILLLMLGCQHVEKPEMPDDLIARDVMIDILTDAYLSNAAKSVNNKVIRQRGIKLDSFLYNKYGIDSLRFVRSHAWYNSDLDTYENMFVEIEKRLADMAAELDSVNFRKKSPIQKKQDSIRKAKGLIDPAESN